jgi:hypothetical protein
MYNSDTTPLVSHQSSHVAATPKVGHPGTVTEGNIHYAYRLSIIATSAIVEIAAVIPCDCFPAFPRLYNFFRNKGQKGSGDVGYDGSKDRSGVISASHRPDEVQVLPSNTM